MTEEETKKDSMSKAPWWPPNPGPLSDPRLTEFDKGAKAMAKALIARFEKLAFELKLTSKEQDALLLAVERMKWEALGDEA